MLEDFKQHFKERFDYLNNKQLLIAVSGGIDSVVLCYLCKMCEIPFTMAHCNFHLRAEDSIEDQVFVEHLAKRLGVDVLVKEFDTETYANNNKVSIQIAARELRYNWFESLVVEGKYDYLLTAHHLDDSIETFLINFSRGTGVEGLLGIPEVNAYIVRPLLIFTRDEINQFALEHNIQWREDYTNAQTKYLRNKFRKLVVPILKEINPQFSNSFLDTISNLSDTNQLAKDAIDFAFSRVARYQEDGSIIFLIDEIKKLSSPKAYLYEMLKPFGFTAWKDIIHLLEAKSGKVIYAKEYILLKDRSVFVLQKRTELEKNKEQIYYLEKGEELKYPIQIKTLPYNGGDLVVDSNTILVDEAMLKFPLVIRKFVEGDRFIPFGMKGTKKVSKYFKDEKFNQFEKENTWLLCSENEIVWIIGSRMDERFKIKSTTTNIIKIQITV
ncbi:tRNA lysidine(34) synthetase TilS [Myroides sp. BIT-d1]|uniref:tRNA(Ile)-lysidine synthase n=2 Tax=Myroides albus TaxID=2562892 RepID=A0A6I3LF72_9FLAO|nr:tRNA lysidine(34) synthetase TilS [Myroides albus]